MITNTNAPNFSALLADAVNKPGSIMKAYSAFHHYSLGNQLLAMFQCFERGIELAPINTFKGWQALGRFVKKGEKALTLCMPLSVKRRASAGEGPHTDAQYSYATAFVYKPRWFVLSQTDGPDIELPALPTWNSETALASLDITRVPFNSQNGNSQGYAQGREIAINPVAQLPHKTLFHEMAHVVLGHTLEAEFSHTEQTTKNLLEVEAESVALLCCEALALEGSEFCRGYIQAWATGNPIPEQSAKKILGAADKILKAGHVTKAQPLAH